MIATNIIEIDKNFFILIELLNVKIVVITL